MSVLSQALEEAQASMRGLESDLAQLQAKHAATAEPATGPASNLSLGADQSGERAEWEAERAGFVAERKAIAPTAI